MQHRILRLLTLVFRWLITSVVRAMITGVIFAISLMITLHYFGIPIPMPRDLIDKFEALGQLASILS